MVSKILRCNEVEEHIGVCKATLYRWIRKGSFPRPLKLGPRAVGWRREDIERWLNEREEA